ncbi:MAG: DUF3352 domain-containing protein [Gemmatimonadetes bacterium]|nr:DUF3352 domain-containing protein [Gemmatimonadota bacterium]
MRRKASAARFGTLLMAFVLVLGCGREDGSAPVAAGVETRAVARALPAGATVVVSGHDLEGFWARLQGTRLYQELKAIQDVQQAMAPLGESRREIQEEICVRFDERTLISLFGGKFDLGFYGPLPEERADLLLVSEVEDENEARSIVQECEAQLVEEKGATFRDERLNGTEVRVATNREGEDVLFYALGDGRLRIGTTLERMRSALAIGEDEASRSMTGVAEYIGILEKLSDASLVVWVDREAFQQATRVAGADTAAAGGENRQRMGAATTALEDYLASALGVGIYWAESGIRSDVYARFPEDGERSELIEMLTTSPGQIQSIGYQPEGTLLYTSIASLDADVVYDELYRYAVDATRIQMDVAGTPDSARADSMVAAQLREFESQTGIDVEDDLVAWIGDEAAFSIVGVDKTGFFPVPEVAFTIAATDRGRAQAALAELEGALTEMARTRASIPLQWQEETYEGQTIRYAPTPMGEGLSVAYTVTDPFVLVASSRGLVKRMLDGRAGRARALPSNPEFGAMTEFYPQRATSIGYVNLERILTEVEGLLGTFGQMSGNPAAADTTSTARRVLTALKNAPRIGFYSEADGEGLFTHLLVEVR